MSQNSYFIMQQQQQQQQQRPIKSGLLNRRQQQKGNYIQPLELPSLPPLSQLLPTNNKVDGNNTNMEAAAAAAAAAVSMNGMIPTTTTFAPQTQPQMMYDYTVQPTATVNPSQYQLNTNPVLVDPATATTTSTDMMAAAVMMPFDSMYTATLQPGLTADPTMMAAPIDYNQSTQQRTRQLSNASSTNSSVEKIYSFVEIPGTNQKKRPRRRYDEIERLYHCNWPGCTKAYGTLNHLNAHVSMQKHGPKRSPSEFKEMRKEWRRQKKEREAQKKAAEQMMKQQQQQQQQSILTNNHHNFEQIPAELNGFY